ncbi:DMT family transporter [Sedimentitalea nanhaiensis]|uniref:Permease of the drug/metabolite transporter (DMT) superfamily n=1 Tax=Sedimentitalea nanhaiensis TaxID=999627 RepID=A0A1I6YE18_9RHOB|nr:DMT family transporter [Sedimentitalea nanhaiensis]SFT48775.1 Permease of the drug/metabolite transporter (DMT) superfamily [Sedimentitalea nanhaiensis]
MQSPEISRKSWIMVAVLGFVWGGTFLVIEIALRGITPFWLAAARIGFGALLTTLVWQLRGGALFTRPPTTAHRINLIAVGVLSSALPFMLISWGQQFVTAGFTGVSMASSALIVLPLAHFLVPGERITPRRAAGFMIGFVGVVILIGGQAFETTGLALELPGRMACVTASACYAVSSVLMRRLPPVDPVGLSAVLLLLGAIVVIPLAWAIEGPPPATDAKTLWVLAFLGLVPTAAANLLRVTVVRTAGPVFMSLVNYMVPVWSVVLGAVLLGEPLPAALLGALALILSGVALSQYGALRRLFSR